MCMVEIMKSIPDKYEYLHNYTAPVKEAERDIIGRDYEMYLILATFSRPELCNVILLAPAGSGKTALVQGVMKKDSNRLYLEVDLARMLASLQSEAVAAGIKGLFDEAEAFSRDEKKELVLFIDEFHQIVQMSPAAVEALKPKLADSGTRGIRVIAATTFVEFRAYLSDNQPLVERLTRINLKEPDESLTVNILKDMAKVYGVDNLFYDDRIYHLIYEYTNRYVPANSQPRKSILILDAMVGWYRAFNRPLDDKLLADIIYATEGVNVTFKVDATKIKSILDTHILAQDIATLAVEERLNICVAGLNDPTKPMSSLLFTGSSGVGKTEMCKQLADLLFKDKRALIRFDMTEYANPDSLERFRDMLTTRVWERPYSILLLDEIEKACSEVTRLLLQVLDDGRLSDRNGRETSFINSYIILTTNAASEIYEQVGKQSVGTDDSNTKLKKYETLIRTSLSETSKNNKFPPELIGRIDAIVPFAPLLEETRSQIAMVKLLLLQKNVWDKHNVKLYFECENNKMVSTFPKGVRSRLVDYLVKENGTNRVNAGGARYVVSKIETEVTSKVAAFINANPGVKRLGIAVEGETAYDNKNILESKAYITIKAQ